jgi:hypothetical protein
LGIILHFIPVGSTDEFQAPDCCVFGALKAICRRLFARHCDAAEAIAVRISDAMQFLPEAWDLLEVNVIEEGWNAYKDELGDLTDDNDEDPSWEE